MPQLLMDLSAHLNDTQPIEVCVIANNHLTLLQWDYLSIKFCPSSLALVVNKTCAMNNNDKNNHFQMTVKKTLSNFRRTHHDNWQQHKQQFTDDQLLVLTDLLVSPCYYA